MDPEHGAPGPQRKTSGRPSDGGGDGGGDGDDDDDLIAERLRWTPRERLDYLLDMLAFEERARRARPLRQEG